MVAGLLVAMAGVVVVPTDPGVKVAAPTTLVAADAASPEVVRDGAGLALVWIHTEPRTKQGAKSCVQVARIDKAGTQLAGGEVELGCDAWISSVDAVVAKRATLVAWSANGTVAGALISTALATKKSIKLPGAFAVVAAGDDGTRFWVLYSTPRQQFEVAPVEYGGAVGTAQLLDLAHDARPTLACGATCVVFGTRSIGGGWSMHGLVLATKPSTTWHPLDSGPLKGVSSPIGLEVPALARRSPYPEGGRTIDHIVGASLSEGAVVTWREEPNSYAGTPGSAGVAYVPTDEKAARHWPIDLGDEGAPTAATLDKTRVLVTTARGGAILGRVVTIDAAYFRSIPAPRPALAQLVITGSDGRPVTTGSLHVSLATRSGGRAMMFSLPSGTFTLPHPEPDDHRPELDVVGATLFVVAGAESSDVIPVAAGTMKIKLRAPGKLAGKVELPKGGKGPVHVHLAAVAPASSARSTTMTWAHDLDTTGSFAVSVPAGRIDVVATTDDGLATYQRLAVTPGSSPKITLKPSRRGTAAITIRDRSGSELTPSWVLLSPGAGADMPNVEQGDSDSIEIEDVIAGEHELVVVVDDKWQMTRRVTIAPDKVNRLELVFKADLEPGMVGAVVIDRGGAVVIGEVVPGTPAEAAQLDAGDVIATIDGAAPADANDAVARLRGAAGTTVKVGVVRNGRPLTVTVTRSR